MIKEKLANEIQATSDGSPVERKPQGLKICLAGSGGGHLRQLLDLETVWCKNRYFFLTEDTALSRSIAEKHPTFYIPHVALGQARLGSPLKMIIAGVRNFFVSGMHIIRERPEVVITTGAGAVFFAVVWARIFGARIIVIESFARFTHPSAFGRLAAPFAHRKVVQSDGLASVWPDAAVFDPLRKLDTPIPPKKPLLFATVGAILPFDRLVEMVLEAKSRGAIPESLVIQTGVGGRLVSGENVSATLTFDRIRETLAEADIVVCHGGTGSLITALQQGCRVIAVPRRFDLGEVYDDHQSEITSAFEARGLIAVANNADELCDALALVRGREPVSATSEPSELIGYLDAVLAEWAKQSPPPTRPKRDPLSGKRNRPNRT